MKKPVKNIQNTLNAFQIVSLLDQSHEKPSMGSEVVGYRGTKWIKWGDDSGAGLFPQRIAEAYQNSKTLRAVLSQKANLVASDLQTANESLQKKISKYTSPKTHYDLRQLIYRVALDLQLHGEGFIKEVRYIEYAGNTPIKERSFAMHLDASQVRFASDVDEYLDPVAVYISKNWAHYTRQEYRPYRLPLAGYGYENYYDEQDRVFKKVCIHRVGTYEPAMQVYGRADWTGAYYDAILESLLPRFNYTHLQNSIHLSGILNVEMPFTPDEDTATEIRDKIREQLKGENAFGPSTPVNISGGDGKLSLVQYNLPTDGAFKDLGRTCERNIIMAAGWHPALMGSEESGKLGNVREVENHHRRVMQYEIEPMQDKILHTYMHTLEGTEYYALAEQSPIYFENKPMFTALDYVSQNKIDEAVPLSEIEKELGYAVDDSE